MELNNLQSANMTRKPRKRVGRGPGSGNGKTAGRGHKGQQSRSGYSRKYGFEGGQMPLHRRLPKRGFHHEKRHPFACVNVALLDKTFADGDTVTAAVLIEKGLAAKLKGGVKLLGQGNVTKKLTVQVEAASPGAIAKIEAAGGAVQLPAKSEAAAE